MPTRGGGLAAAEARRLYHDQAEPCAARFAVPVPVPVPVPEAVPEPEEPNVREAHEAH